MDYRYIEGEEVVADEFFEVVDNINDEELEDEVYNDSYDSAEEYDGNILTKMGLKFKHFCVPEFFQSKILGPTNQGFRFPTNLMQIVKLHEFYM